MFFVMKKLLISLLWLSLAFWFVFWNSVQDNLVEKKDDLLVDLWKVNTALLNWVEDLQDELDDDQDFKILQSLWKLSLIDLKDNVLNRYFELKTNIFSDYSNINSQIVILDERKNLWLDSQSTYTTKLSDLSADVSSFESKYLELIASYQSIFSWNINWFENELSTSKEDNASLLKTLKAQAQDILDIMTKYDEFSSLLKTVNNFYGTNYDNIYKFVSEVKNITAEQLEKSLNSLADTYYDKYSNLDYYQDNIDQYINSLISTYKLDVDDYLDELVQNFYSQDDYEFIQTHIQELKAEYFSGDLDYSKVSDSDLDSVYKTLWEKLDEVIGSVNEKLANLEFPEEMSDLEAVLTDKIQEYYDTKKTDKSTLLKTYINNYVELLWYKLTSELDSYNVLMSKFDSLRSLSGSASEQITQLDNILDTAKTTIDNIIDKSLKATLSIQYWTYVSKRIDLVISKNWLTKYNATYKNIDTTLKTILEWLYKEAEAKDKIDELNSKISSALDKVDTYLWDSKLSTTSQYLLLKIKKAFIWFKYLR